MNQIESLLSEEAVRRVVRGQLKTTISAHGPITGPFIDSAARRISHDILGHLRQASLKDVSNQAAELEVNRLRKELKDAKDLFEKKQQEIKGLLFRLQDVVWNCSKCGKSHGLGHCRPEPEGK